jgi:hypothetical protein
MESLEEKYSRAVAHVSPDAVSQVVPVAVTNEVQVLEATEAGYAPGRRSPYAFAIVETSFNLCTMS